MTGSDFKIEENLFPLPGGLAESNGATLNHPNSQLAKVKPEPDAGSANARGADDAKKPEEDKGGTTRQPLSIPKEEISTAPQPRGGGALPASIADAPESASTTPQAQAPLDPKPDQPAAPHEASEPDDADGPNPEKTAFPVLLHAVVTDPATDYCIHWLQCGTRFMITDKKIFAKDVLPRLYGRAKFTSFTRRLKRWSFSRVPSGPCSKLIDQTLFILTC